MVNEKRMSAKNSGGPNLRANEAMKPVKKINAMLDTKSGKHEEYNAICNALFAWPFCANGKPSKTVHAAAGVPGVFIKIAGIEPP